MSNAALILAISAAYNFPAGSNDTYQLKATFDGFLPILGGNTGVVVTNLTVDVKGSSTNLSDQKATSELKAFDISFNDVKLPLGIEEAEQYFPKTLTEFDSQGLVTKSDAPNVQLPVRLPGLDVKRFADITYLPLIFPASDFEKDHKWSFDKLFDGAKMAYECTFKESVNGQIYATFTVKQVNTYFENEVLEVTIDKEKAISEVTTEMSGTGNVWFDTSTGRVSQWSLKTDSTSKVKNLTSNEVADRKLKIAFEVKRKGATVPVLPGATPVQPAQPRQISWWDRVDALKVIATRQAQEWKRWAESELGNAVANLSGKQAWKASFSRVINLWKNAPWMR